uniref:Extensin-like n=1 Tax=Cicer arietinum TaxID=3827 RepID=A0A1S3EAG7_CICAR|nr:extensin-like [Cicer arietinum]
MARTKQSARKNASLCTPPSSSSSYQSRERSPSPPPRPSPPHSSSASPSPQNSQEVLNLMPLFPPKIYLICATPPLLQQLLFHPVPSLSSSPSTDPKAISDKTPTPERSPPPPERSPEHIPSHPTLFAQTSGTIPSHIPSYSQPPHCPTHYFSTLLSNPLLSTISPLFVSPQKTSSSIFGISQFLNFPAPADHSTSSVGPLPSISSSFASLPSLSAMPIPSNTVVAASSQPSAHLPSTSTLAGPSNSDIMAALQIIMTRQIQHDQETALLRTWMADHLAPKLGIPPPPPHPVPPPSQIPPAGKSSSSEGSSPSLAS